MIPGVVASQAMAVEDEGEGPGDTTVSFLSSFDGTDGATTATDDSTFAHSMTFLSGAQLDTDQKKFGTASLLMDNASSDRVTVPNHSSFLFGSGQFTVEAFIRPANVLFSYQPLLSVCDNVNQFSWELAMDGDELVFVYSTIGTDQWEPIRELHGMTANSSFHHVAVDRDGSNILRAYIDGTMIDSADLSGADPFHDSTQVLTIGSRASGSVFYDGHMDEVRIIKGAAEYASDSGFTPPSSPFPRP